MRRIRSESLIGLVERTLSVKRLQAVRLLAEELDRLDTELIAGLKVQGLGTEHLYGSRLPASRRWRELAETIDGVSRAGWPGAARELRPDVCLFDIRMPGTDGIEATRQLAGSDVDDPLAVIVITTFDLDEYVHGALKAGARGFLLKDAVKIHLVSLMAKLGARNRVEIAMWAYETDRIRR